MPSAELRDLDVMRDETAQDPNNARWWYDLGQTLEGLGEHREAAEAYGRCYDLRGSWAEQAAWASFRAASCLVRLRDFEQALRISALGLTRQPQSPELACLYGEGVGCRVFRADMAIRTVASLVE